MTPLRGFHFPGIRKCEHGRSLCRFRPKHPEKHRRRSIEDAAIESRFGRCPVGQKRARLIRVRLYLGAQLMLFTATKEKSSRDARGFLGYQFQD